MATGVHAWMSGMLTMGSPRAATSELAQEEGRRAWIVGGRAGIVLGSNRARPQWGPTLQETRRPVARWMEWIRDSEAELGGGRRVRAECVQRRAAHACARLLNAIQTKPKPVASRRLGLNGSLNSRRESGGGSSAGCGIIADPLHVLEL